MTETDTDDGQHEEEQQTPGRCPDCGGHDTEKLRKEEARMGDEIFQTFSCNECYAGWEVEYRPVSKEITLTSEEAMP